MSKKWIEMVVKWLKKRGTLYFCQNIAFNFRLSSYYSLVITWLFHWQFCEQSCIMLKKNYMFLLLWNEAAKHLHFQFRLDSLVTFCPTPYQNKGDKYIRKKWPVFVSWVLKSKLRSRNADRHMLGAFIMQNKNGLYSIL